LLNDGQPKGKTKGRIFLSKAIIVLCRTDKCRDADVLQNYIYDKQHNISDLEVENLLKLERTDEQIKIPPYAYDCHTQRGKIMGKTKRDFFLGEQNGLQPRQKGLFDDVYKTI
jgi:hypothetical protein